MVSFSSISMKSERGVCVRAPDSVSDADQHRFAFFFLLHEFLNALGDQTADRSAGAFFHFPLCKPMVALCKTD